MSEGSEHEEANPFFVIVTNPDLPVSSVYKMKRMRWHIENDTFHELTVGYNLGHFYCQPGAENVLLLQLLALTMCQAWLLNEKYK